MVICCLDAVVVPVIQTFQKSSKRLPIVLLNSYVRK